MAEAAVIAERAHPLSGRVFAGTGVALTPAPAAFRSSLRCPPGSVAALSAALGVDLPTTPKASATKDSRSALWLGPDEWLVIDEKQDPAGALKSVPAPHALVDISHRNTAILVSGPAAADCINAGCPQDLTEAAFAVGAASRTVFGKAEIVLWRVKPAVYRIEVWRSFSDYVFSYLAEAARDPA
ncbi:MAG: sarcosine oxidase subunit gamma [Roseitalea porphyridii]|jgi:sarcosine oxidase subunit gamma|uniref:sarcosine oxidase subunit gamma n=1 Tax=Roseitalea porphyridii TaxID=1852022 RepID=UPI0032EE7D43